MVGLPPARLQVITYIHATHACSPTGRQRRLKYSSETPTFYQNDLAIRSTLEVTGGKPIAVRLQSISGGDAVNLLVAFYDIHVRKREVLIFCSVPDTTRDNVMHKLLCLCHPLGAQA
jgi:hypothetical protein